MKFTSDNKNGVIVLSPDGNILGGPEASSLNEELHRLLDRNQLRVVVDLSRVDLMNSSGLGMLIGAFTTLKNSGGGMALACVNQKVQHLLVISKLTNVFPSFPTVDEAVSSFS